MVGELTLAIQKGLTADDLSAVIHPHPTFSEMLFGAAEGGGWSESDYPVNGREIEPGIWHWEEDYRVYCTLVQGERLAILWDTGQGKQEPVGLGGRAGVHTLYSVQQPWPQRPHWGEFSLPLGLCPSGGLAAAGCPGQIDRERLVGSSPGAGAAV